MAEYSIYKDEKVVNTIKNIKNKLKEVGIVLNEEIITQTIKDKYMPCSLRVYFNKTSIGTNGKGTCLENALASGYSEFMERLQNYFLNGISPKHFSYSPDEFVSSLCFENLKDYSWRKSIINNNLLHDEKNKTSIYNMNENIQIDNVYMTPFYSVKDNKIVNLPIEIIQMMQGSNGMSAGNTYEEALVQGFSEVCERYSMYEIILNNISMPEIPKENYWKYDKIRGMIEYLEKYGYKVIIKDASMGIGMPTVVTVLENEKDKLFFLSFGCHPSLCVAIERTLTEFVQGLDLSIVKKIDKLRFMQNISEYKQRRFVFNQFFYKKYVIKKGDKKFFKNFFNKSSSYKFSPDTWIDDNQKNSNKDLVAFLYNRISKLTDEIYIRNVSFLNFPAVYIYVPSVSIWRDVYESFTRMDYLKLFNNINYIDEIDIEKLFFIFENHILDEEKSYTFLPDEYLALLCSIVRQNDKDICKYLDMLFFLKKHKGSVLEKDKFWIFKIMKDYYGLKKKNYEKEKILETLSQKYSKEKMAIYQKFISNLNFEAIKKIIKYNIQHKSKNNGKKDSYIIDIEERLSQVYRENVPDQMIFSKIFSDIK